MRLLVLVMLLLLAPFGVSQPQSLVDLELKSVSAPETSSLSRYAGRPLVLVFFEPECSWCFRQVRALNEVLEACPGGVQPLAVGINGSRKALIEEYRRLRPAFPAYQASSELLARVGTIPATPFTLLADADGNPVSWLRGYVPGEQLQLVLREQLGMDCAA